MDIQKTSIPYDTSGLSKTMVQDGTLVTSNQQNNFQNKEAILSPNSASSFNGFLEYLDYSLIWKPSFNESKDELIRELKVHIIDFKKKTNLKDKVKSLEKITFYSQRMLQGRKNISGKYLFDNLQDILDLDDTYFENYTFSNIYSEITAGTSQDLPYKIKDILRNVTINNSSALKYLESNPVNIIFLNKFAALYTADDNEVGRSDALTKTILIDTYNEYTGKKRPLWEIASLIIHETYHANNSIKITNIYKDESNAYKLQLEFMKEFKKQNPAHKDMQKINKAIDFYKKMYQQNMHLWKATKEYTN